MAALEEAEFRAMFRRTPVVRARYTGFLRNVAIAMGATGLERFAPAAREAGGPRGSAGQRTPHMRALARLAAVK